MKWFKRERDLYYDKPCATQCQYANDVGMPEYGCKGKFCVPLYATKEQEMLLPKASLITVQWHWFWFRWKWSAFTRKDKRMSPSFYLRTRFANAVSLNFGPVHITLRQRWLSGPARSAIEQQVRMMKQ